jgi:conjugative relaxase-like TrwC/TraI family protein
MLRITPSHSADGASKYFDAALARSDYYGSETGGWAGKGAELLGLQGDVSREQFVALASNQRPDTKERLTPRTNDTRTETKRVFDPKTKTWIEKEVEVSNRRAGYDFCFSAPKSVSIYLAETADKAVERMVHEAVRETMAAVEANMETRLRGKDEDGNERDGDENRTTGNMLYGSFVHRETRPIEGVPDPHYHIHCYAFNATFDEVEQRWKAGQFGDIKKDGPLYEAIFHARLAEKINAAGFGIRRTDHNFELVSVSPELVEKFSKRTKLIEDLARQKYTILEAKARALMKESGLDFGDAFAKVKSELGAESREKKSASKLSYEEQLADWRAQMTPEERESLTFRAVRAAKSEGLITAEAAKDLAISDLFERVSVKRDSHVAAMLLRRGIGRVSIEEALSWPKSDAFIRPRSDGKLVSTREVLAAEQAMIQTAAAGQGREDELGRGGQWTIRNQKVASDEGQRNAVQHVLESKDLVTSIRGPAGTGKSTMAKEAVQAVEALSGRSVLLFAPSSSAVGVLKKEGFAKSDTFKQLEINETLQDAARGQVLWIDEAAFLSVKQMRWLVDFAEQNRCRVILAGDTRQHHGVERGDALRIMERAGAVAQAALSKIFRQQSPALRAAMYDLSGGRTEAGFDKLDKFGAIREMEDRQARMDAIAQTHLAAIKEGKSSLIVSPTHHDARAVADVVRQAMRAEGLLTGEDQTVTRLQRLNLTEGQRRDAINYEPGQVVEFHQITKGDHNGTKQQRFRVGEHWRVVRRQGGAVVVESGGQEKLLPLNQAGKFEVYRQEQLALAVGDKIRVTKNFTAGGQRYSNNELHKVAGIDGARISLDNGRTIDGGMFHVDQGIVVTSHASQGKTVDQVIASVPVSAFSQANEAQFYVSMSRARQAMHLFTDSKVALREAVCRPSERLSSYELEESQREVKRMQRAARNVDLQQTYGRPRRPEINRKDRGMER